MSLAVEEYPNPAAPTLVLVHGFTQNARCWGELPRRLQRRFRVLTVDAPGHGRSPAEHDDADLAEAARLIGEAGGPATYLGYSMGGRMCLQLACDDPSRVERLVLVGGTAGLVDADERAARRLADEQLARRLERDSLGVFLDHWLALPLFSGLDRAAAGLAERLTNRPAGLAASLRHCGTGAQQPLWDRLDTLTMPVLLLTGALDTKFGALAAAMAGRMTSTPARVASIAGAGHTAHLERPEEFLQALEHWWEAAQRP